MLHRGKRKFMVNRTPTLTCLKSKWNRSCLFAAYWLTWSTSSKTNCKGESLWFQRFRRESPLQTQSSVTGVWTGTTPPAFLGLQPADGLSLHSLSHEANPPDKYLSIVYLYVYVYSYCPIPTSVSRIQLTEAVPITGVPFPANPNCIFQLSEFDIENFSLLQFHLAFWTCETEL